MDMQRGVTDGVTRALAAVGLAGVARVHVLDAPWAFEDAPYRGVLYVLLIIGCIATGAALVRGGDRLAWAAAAFLPAVTIVAYVLSRTVGVPQRADDVGNSGEPLGIASLFVVSAVVGLATSRLRAFAPAVRRELVPARG